MPVFSREKEVEQPEAAEAPPEPNWLSGAPEPGSPERRDFAAHVDFVLGHVETLRPFGVTLLDSAGLTLCESIVADLDLPTHTSATTDGWAVRASNLVGASKRMPIVMPVVGELRYGAARSAALPKGAAVRVEAGAPVPDGADAVVAFADGLEVRGNVQFVSEATFQQNMRLAGSRVADGEVLVRSGSELTPRTLGLIAEFGLDKVLARPKPRVVVLTADPTLVEPGRPLTKLYENYDACTTLLAASARRDGAQVFTAASGSIDPAKLATTLSEQLVRADLVFLVTEASEELVDMLGREGAVDLAEVDALPGHQVFALFGPERAPVLVLPPGAVPAYFGYLLVGRPIVRRLAGLDEAVPEEVRLPALEAFEALPARPRLALGRLVAGGVTPVAAVDPGAAELARADAVVFVPPAAEPVPAGTSVACWPLT